MESTPSWLEVMTESPIGSPMLKARVPLIFDSSGEAWFDVDLMHKDIRLALETAEELHVRFPRRAPPTRC